MTPGEANQIADLVQRVQRWLPPMRIAQARRILETLETSPVAQPPDERPRGPTAAEIAAMFKTDKPAPDDEELMRKYGS